MSSLISSFSNVLESPIQHIYTSQQATTSTSEWNNNFGNITIKAGDLIVVTLSRPYFSIVNIVTTGYTLLFTSSINTNYDATTRVWYKIADGTETSVTFQAVNSSYGAISFVSVFRGVDNTNPFDVPYVEVAESSYGSLTYTTAPDIYPTTAGSLIVKHIHSPLAGDPTTVQYNLYPKTGSKTTLLRAYRYTLPNIKSTSSILITTDNEALKSFWAIPNLAESLNTNFGQAKYALALRPA